MLFTMSTLHSGLATDHRYTHYTPMPTLYILYII